MKKYVVVVDIPINVFELVTEEYSGVYHLSKAKAKEELKRARRDTNVYFAYIKEVGE